MGEIKDMLLSPLFKKTRAALSYISLVTQQKPGQSNDNFLYRSETYLCQLLLQTCLCLVISYCCCDYGILNIKRDK